jgi:hypothetical protein
MSEWSWSHCSWIYYRCNQCLSPQSCEFEFRSWRGVLDTILCDKVCQWLVVGQWFSPGTPVSSTNKTDRHDITAIVLKVALKILTLTHNDVVRFLFLTKQKIIIRRRYKFINNRTGNVFFFFLVLYDKFISLKRRIPHRWFSIMNELLDIS